MKKELMLRAGSIALLLSLMSGSSAAAPIVDLVWRTSGTSVLDPLVDAPDKRSDRLDLDLYFLDIVLRADATEITGVFVSIGYDETELQYRGGFELSNVAIGGGVTFRPVSPNNPPLMLARPGLVLFFDTAAFPLNRGGLVSASATLGSVSFTAFGGVDDGFPDVQGEITPGFDAILSTSGADVTGLTVFGTASVINPQPGLPEPTSGLLLVCGLVGLIAAGRRGSADRDGR